VTAAKWQLKSAVLNWPGSDVLVEGARPNEWAAYDESLPDDERVDRVLQWLDDDLCSLCMLYFSIVDVQGHKHGPNSTEVAAAVASVDSSIGRLLNGLRQRGVLAEVNVLLVSDHGMTDVSYNNTDTPNFIFIDDVYTDTDYVLVDVGANALVLPLNASTAPLLFTALQNLSHSSAYYSDVSSLPSLPPRLHYSGNPLIPPIVVAADEGYEVTNRSATYPQKGAHGFDPALSDMAAVMVLTGPAVMKKGALLKEVQSVDIYVLMCALLGIPAAKNEGDLSQFSDLLRH
jgi:predicted AlkP superfamily pyrophosphatase or phosphodiesterase